MQKKSPVVLDVVRRLDELENLHSLTKDEFKDVLNSVIKSQGRLPLSDADFDQEWKAFQDYKAKRHVN